MGTPSNRRAGQTAADALSRTGQVYATPSTTLASTPGSGGGNDPGWISGILDSLGIWGGGSGTAPSTTPSAPPATWPDVVRVLDNLIGGSSATAGRSPHREFWRGANACSNLQTQRISDLPGLSSHRGQPYDGRLFVPRDPDASYVLKALKGEYPFNAGSGGLFRRMPPSRTASTSDIAIIESWINAGCPCSAAPSPSPSPAPAPPSTSIPTWGGSRPFQVDTSLSGSTVPDTTHNQFWREFDYWSLSQARRSGSPVGALMGHIQGEWTAANQGRGVSNWDSYVNSSAGSAELRPVADGLAESLRRAYGDPLPIGHMYAGFAKFGENTLPVDPAPQRSISTSKELHCMDQRYVWTWFCGLADGCVRSGYEASYFEYVYKAIMIGFACDVYHFSNQSGGGVTYSRNQSDPMNNTPSSLPGLGSSPTVAQITSHVHGIAANRLFTTLKTWL